MKRSIAVGLAAAVIALTAVPGAAHATQAAPVCGLPTGWYANADEQTRLPTPTAGGLQFSGNDLIHHAATGTIEAMTPGTFSAHPAPDQPSFFSVEVINADLTGYATLRWNATTSKWDMVTGGQIYSNASPAALVDMPTAHKSHRVISFGVGYTANPPGTVTTTVRSVRFGGHTYDLRCKPVIVTHSPKPHPSHTSASPSASASASHSASPSASASTSASASSSPVAAVVTTNVASNEPGGLPVTGPGAGLIAGGAILVLGAGGILFLLARRRRVRFSA